MSKTMCSADGCAKPVKTRGLCATHYMQLRRSGVPLEPIERPQRPERTCSIEDCGKPVFARWMCNAHYKKWRRQQVPSRFCQFEGCDRPHESRGYCKNHARQIREGGTVRPLRSQRSPRICTVEACGDLAVGRGWCTAHYKRWQKYGDPLAGRPRKVHLPGAAVCQAEDCEAPPLGKSGMSGQFCRPHLHRARRYGDANWQPPWRLAPDVAVKPCTRCGIVKPLAEFGPLKEGQLGLRPRCYDCEAEVERRLWAAASPEAKERRRLTNGRSHARSKYGEAGVTAYMRIQMGAGCDICGNRTPKMAIDHDHETGEVRGILCKDCNLILGWVKDDPERLLAMATYLESPPGVVAA